MNNFFPSLLSKTSNANSWKITENQGGSRMKKGLALVLALLFVLTVAPLARANGSGGGTGGGVGADFGIFVWFCDARTVIEDCTQEGRTSDCGEKLVERRNNYAFTGEQIEWNVLVWDKNGREKIKDTFVAISPDRPNGRNNDEGGETDEDFIEANCDETAFGDGQELPESCNARFHEEEITTFDQDTMRGYKCKVTVEPQHHGENWIFAEAVDLDGNSDVADEEEFWFLNPEIALTIDGSLDFGKTTPGTVSYSEPLLVGNDAEPGSGVLLDMFLAGTDWYDPDNSGAKCPDSNVLKLANFRYYATSGAYDTKFNPGSDAEGYDSIPYIDFDPTRGTFGASIIDGATDVFGYPLGNVLSPGSEVAVTFKLALPEPCNGNFQADGETTGMFFWGEAV